MLLLGEQGFRNVAVIDRHTNNLAILRHHHPWVEAIEADLATPGPWESAVMDADAAVMLQAQIGGTDPDAFRLNNVVAAGRVLAALREGGRHPFLVHISSSVVGSQAHDWYTESKKEQERLVVDSGLAHCILRPSLMFGWFDRKHLGWLARFMARVPVFPIPGNGRYMRQPLYAKDFCRIILACLQRRPQGAAHDITGLEKIDYIDLICAIRRVTGVRTPVVRIPYALFWLLLRTYAVFSANPPFTIHQLRALVTPDEFPVEPWERIFGVQATPLAQALQDVFGPSPHRDVVLEL